MARRAAGNRPRAAPVAALLGMPLLWLLALLMAAPVAAAKPPGRDGSTAGRPSVGVHDEVEAPVTRNKTAEGLVRDQIFENYDKMSFPWTEHGTANVSINIAFHRVLDVNLYAGSMKVSCWMRLRWNDPRLTWDAKSTGVFYMFADNPSQDESDIWFPDITLWNAGSDISSTLGLKWMRIENNGDVYWTRNGAIEVSCNFVGLESYPFGKIACDLEMGSWIHPGARINLTLWETGAIMGGSATDSRGAVHVEYSLKSVSAVRHVYGACSFPPCTLDDEGEWPVVLFRIVLERASVLYTFKILLPQIILTMVAFSTFWLSPECGERLGLAITVPLAVAVYDLLVFSSLPTSNKINFVSAMGLLAFLFSIAVLVENALSIQLYFYREPSYLTGLGAMGQTLMSYRQQSEWVGVLGIIQELKQELVKHQMMRHKATDKNVGRTPLSRSLTRGASMRAARSIDAIASPTPDPAPGPADAAPTLAPPAGRWTMEDGRWTSDGTGPMDDAATAETPETAETAAESRDASAAGQTPVNGRHGSGGNHVSLALGGPATAGGYAAPRPALRWRFGGKGRQGAGEGAAASGPSQHGAVDVVAMQKLLSSDGPERLEEALEDILDDDDPGLHKVQRKIRAAAASFGGLRVLARRLHTTLVDDEDEIRKQETSVAELKQRLGDAYNLRWQLLSSVIDHASRWIFVVAYVVSVLTTAITLVTRAPPAIQSMPSAPTD